MASRGPSFWIPRAPSTARWPSVLPYPRVYFGFACWHMRSLLSHLCPPWSYYYSLKSLPKPWKWFQIVLTRFCEFRMTKIKKQEGCARVFVIGCGIPTPLMWLICLWAQLFGSQHHKASPCWKELAPLVLIGNWLLIPHSNHLEEGCLIISFGDFPGGAVVKNPPANAGDTGSIPGPGRSHMLQSN